MFGSSTISTMISSDASDEIQKIRNTLNATKLNYSRNLWVSEISLESVWIPISTHIIYFSSDTTYLGNVYFWCSSVDDDVAQTSSYLLIFKKWSWPMCLKLINCSMKILKKMVAILLKFQAGGLIYNVISTASKSRVKWAWYVSDHLKLLFSAKKGS